jgi:hypothetical protein
MDEMNLTSTERHPHIRPHRQALFSASAKRNETGENWRINMIADYVPSQDGIVTDDPVGTIERGDSRD